MGISSLQTYHFEINIFTALNPMMELAKRDFTHVTCIRTSITEFSLDEGNGLL